MHFRFVLFALFAVLGGAQVTWVTTVTTYNPPNNVAKMAYSTDGVSYTVVSTPFSSFTTTLHNDVVFAQNKWIVAGYNSGLYNLFPSPMLSSLDGMTWSLTNTSAPSFMDGWANCVCYGAFGWIAVGGQGSYNKSVGRSDDGLNWVEVTFATIPNIPRPTTCGWSPTLSQYVMGGSIAFGGNAPLAYSNDGVNWIGVSSPPSITAVFDVAYGKGLWVAVGNANSGNPRMSTSADGVTWTAIALPPNGNLYGIGISSTTFIAVGGGVKLINSTDGITWTPYQSAGESYSAWGLKIAFNAAQNRWTSVGYGGATLYSIDNGRNWTSTGSYAVTQAAPFVGGVATNGLLGAPSTTPQPSQASLSHYSCFALLLSILVMALV